MFENSTLINQQTGLDQLVVAMRSLRHIALEEARTVDEVGLFPKQIIAAYGKEGLLSAVLPPELGGKNLGILPGTNLALLRTLKYAGAGNLVAARVLEGHYNALMLMTEYGTKNQLRTLSEHIQNFNLSGVWNTQSANYTQLTPMPDGTFSLSGEKIFATGVGLVHFPIVTAQLPDKSWQMICVDMQKADLAIDTKWWKPMGMKGSSSFSVAFQNTPITKDEFIGSGGNYYEEPWFSGGAVRFAAIQLGGAEMLMELTRDYLLKLNRQEDAFQKMRMGEMAILVESGNQWLLAAARQMDEYMLHPTAKESKQRFISFIHMTRTAIAKICVDIIELTQKCVGARGLNQPYHFERIIRDLLIYIRQPAPDAAIVETGHFVFNSHRNPDQIWATSQQNDSI